MLESFHGQHDITETLPVIQDMHKSSVLYTLTGSRFFGHERPDSDWDFFAMNHAKVTADLIRMRFKVRHEFDTVYNHDDQTEYVYEHKSEAGVVQVALVKDTAVKIDARDMIKQFHAEYHKGLKTEDRITLWDMWYNMVAKTPKLVSPTGKKWQHENLDWLDSPAYKVFPHQFRQSVEAEFIDDPFPDYPKTF